MANPRRRATALAAAAAAGAAALHVLAALRTPLGAASDDALHLLLARNLAHGGFAVPDAAGIPVTDPLPGFALVMAPFVDLLSPHWGLLRAAALLAAAALAVCAWRLCRRLSGEAAAWAAALLVACNPTLAGWAGVAMPDIPFAAASAGAFLLLSQDEPLLPALAALAAWAALLRPQGAILAAALAAGLGFRAGPRRAAAFIAAALAPLGLWLTRNRLLAGTATSYVANWKDLNAFSGAGFLVRAATLAAGLARGFFGDVPAPFALAGLAAAVAAAGFGARALWRSRARGARTVLLAVVVYLVGLTALHLGWRAWQSRYALPFLVPFLPLWAAAFAVLYRKNRFAALAVALLAAAPGFWRSASFAAEGVSSPRVELWPRTAAWLRENVPPGASVISTEPYLVALTTGRRAYFPPAAPSRETWAAGLRASGVRFILVRGGPARAYLSAGARDRLTDFDDWAVPSPPLTLAFTDDSEGTTVLRLD